MAQWRYPGYLPKPPHHMSDVDWQTYKAGLSKDQKSERYSGITSDLIPSFEMIQAQGLGDINPDPYKRPKPYTPYKSASPYGSADGSRSLASHQTGAADIPYGSDGSVENLAYSSPGRTLPTDRSLTHLPSKSQMDDHYLNGEGRSITVPIKYLPINEVDWSKASRDLIRSSQASYGDNVKGVVHVSFYGKSAWDVLGQMNFDLTGTIKTFRDGKYEFEGGVGASGGGEMYDFDMHSGLRAIPRNFFTWVGKPRWDRDPSSEPQPFFINMPGTYGIRFSGHL